MQLTDNVIGVFVARDASAQEYYLDSIIDSPYETEDDGASDSFRRRLNRFSFTDSPFSFSGDGPDDIVSSNTIWLLDFHRDTNEITLRTDWDAVDLNYDPDDIDSIRNIVFHKGDEEWEFNWYSPTATFMRTVYPSSYTAPS